MEKLKLNHWTILILFIFCLSWILDGKCQPNRPEVETISRPVEKQGIMLALLLDTSNSMDGLIDQAKSQLWKIVNELASSKCANGDRPSIKIALYEYGNDNLPSAEGYIRLVTPLTEDLDLISEKLFSLSTRGGNEFCGQVIKNALTQLNWSPSHADLKLIFIAGNEPFTQGTVPYRGVCSWAKEKGVVVNTIFCGQHEEGISTSWKSGADLTGGNYMSIEQNKRTVYVPTPYDERIEVLNDQLNKTYIYFGSDGEKKKEMQEIQDANAGSYSRSNKVERAVTKSSSAYKNDSWDLVDASKEDDKIIEKADSHYLPEEMMGMTLEQKKAYVKKKESERTQIKNEIQELEKKRRVFQANHMPTQADMLDKAIVQTVKEQAKRKNFKFD